MSGETRNSEVLRDFVSYCETHPTQRFWQALRNWSGCPFVSVSAVKLPGAVAEDTFNWEGRNK